MAVYSIDIHTTADLAEIPRCGRSGVSAPPKPPTYLAALELAGAQRGDEQDARLELYGQVGSTGAPRSGPPRVELWGEALLAPLPPLDWPLPTLLRDRGWGQVAERPTAFRVLRF